MASELDTCMRALLAAPEDRRAIALRVLTGQPEALPAKSQTEPYLTLRQVSQATGLSATTLWRYGVPGHELGGRRRFRMSEVVAYLESDAFRDKARELKNERRQKTK